jgi:hypothetical protein
MSSVPLETRPKTDRPKPKRGHGCAIAAIALVVLIVLGAGILYWHDQSARRERVRDQLRVMGIGRWAHCLTHFEITFVFTGSSACYYKLSIPPEDVDAFLTALEERGWTRTTESFPATGSRDDIDEPWWRPEDEVRLQVMGIRSLWHVAASKDTGHVYMYKEGR